ncbi:MAG TPA: multicopper oxidase domain-containing protein [Myxococcales bacterium]|nr:multicopper oxidase domain-containing protein [Myxococcales bacterium]
MLAAGPGRADEFRNPRVIEVRAPGGDLTIRARRGTAAVPGLGEVEQVYAYDVRRGRSLPPESAGAVELMPPVISIERGSTLRILYRNELLAADATGKKQPTESNLHTHGLIVSPKGSGNAFGDCVFVMASTRGSGTTHHSTGDPCSLDPAASLMRAEDGDIRYSYVIPTDHPSGLYWFHPHPHGLSEGQVWNGLAGLMTIGNVWDTTYVKCRITASPDIAGLGACRDQEAQREELEAERTNSLEVRYLAFKDLQVAKVKDRSRFRLIEFPLRPDARDRSASAAFAEQTDARKSRCGKLAVSGTGELSYVDGAAGPGQCWQKAHPDERWIFTVSGQIHPRITVKPGRAEAWYLANISADVTYRLRLETVEENPRRLAFEVRALDGAAFPPDQTNRRHTEIVLMPGARVEVLLQRCAGGDTDCVDPAHRIEARLRTAGMATGIDADSGDQWPAVDLASVVFEAVPGAASVQGKASPHIERAASSPAPAVRPSTPPASACDYARYQAGPADLRVDSNLVRLIRFNNRDFGEHGGELFGIHVENFRMLDPDGKTVAVADLLAEGRLDPGERPPSRIASISLEDPCWRAATGERADPAGFARFYPAFRMDGPPNLTAAYGAREYWLLVNDSDECHNFHIHQTKFLVLDADFTASGGGAQCLGDRGVAPPVNRNVLHDTYPLPPRSRVLVGLRFDGPKLGRFVFHCHILEHEDKGMMATIGVVAR